jgi:hypothetical protein
VVVLTGARQTGKTSTFRRLFPNHEFVSLDLPTEAEQAEKEPQTFLQRHPMPVMIDEVQYAPGFVVDVAGRLEVFEAKWAEVPAAGDAVNLDFVRDVVGKSRIAGAAVVCRTAIAIRSPTRFELCPLWTWPSSPG